MPQYYWNLFTIAFNGAWAIGSSLAGGLAIIMGIIVWRFPKWETPMNNLYWIVPLSMFLILLVVRLIVAPYDIYNNQQKIISELQIINENPRLEVTSNPIFGIYKYSLTITNESNQNANNSIAILETVDSVVPSSGYSIWGNLLINRRLAWEDTDSVPSKESTRLDIALVDLNNNNPTIRPAYEKADNAGTNYLFPDNDLIIVISIRSDNCNPLYSVLYLQKKINTQDINKMGILASNLTHKPTIEECREMVLR